MSGNEIKLLEMTLSGVAVSNGNEPLQFVCNTGLKAIREKTRINGLMAAAQTSKLDPTEFHESGSWIHRILDPLDPGIQNPESVSSFALLLCCYCK